MTGVTRSGRHRTFIESKITKNNSKDPGDGFEPDFNDPEKDDIFLGINNSNSNSSTDNGDIKPFSFNQNDINESQKYSYLKQIPNSFSSNSIIQNLPIIYPYMFHPSISYCYSSPSPSSPSSSSSSSSSSSASFLSTNTNTNPNIANNLP
jgi:hypothetical protein